MKKHGTVRPSTGNQVAELFSSIAKVILSFVQILNFEQAKWLISHKTQLANAIRDAIRSLVGSVGDLPDYLIWWHNFYREEGIEIDFSSFQIPDRPEGDWWLILVAPGMTCNKVIQVLRKKFKVWVYTEDLDVVIDFEKEQRRAVDKPYAVWVKANVEADPELKNKSANDLGDTPAVTLMERLLLEVFHFCFASSGKHLDVQNITLCAGSRYCDGSVPSVLFHSAAGKVIVDWALPGNRGDDLRSRQAVSA